MASYKQHWQRGFGLAVRQYRNLSVVKAPVSSDAVAGLSQSTLPDSNQEPEPPLV